MPEGQGGKGQDARSANNPTYAKRSVGTTEKGKEIRQKVGEKMTREEIDRIIAKLKEKRACAPSEDDFNIDIEDDDFEKEIQDEVL